MTAKKSPKNQTVYQIKITLKRIRPPIWRRVQVLSSTTLEEFHLIIQEAMGWCGGHLHVFTIDDVDYGEPDPQFDFDILSQENVKLDQAFDGEKSKFTYTYDFGDDWEHEILLEKELPYSSDIKYPRCITGKRACPPEDCGGPWGYAELLEIMANPSHPEYEERMEWMDESFDPNSFDVEEVNLALQAMG